MLAVLVYDVIHAHGCGSLWCITHAFEAMLQLVNMMIVGRLPHLVSFLDSSSITMKKSNGGGTRPIAVGALLT
jgi:hypothetical protein